MYVEFNNVVLSDFIKVSKFETSLGSGRKNYSKDIPYMDGEIYQGYKKETKTITLEFDINVKTDDEFERYVDYLASVLEVEEPSKLVIDRTDRYYMAVYDGKVDKTKILKGRGGFKLTFKCFDPYSYSSEYKLFESNSDNVFTIENKGNKKAYPTVNVAFNNEAHFVQVTNWDGKTVLVGNRPSADNTSSKPSNVVVSDTCEATANWLPSGNVVDADRVVEGSITVSDNGMYITSGNFGNSTEAKWHGPAVRRNLGENVKDFEIKATMIMKSKFGGQEDSNSGNTTTGNYKVTASALNLRSGRGTSYKVLTSIPKNTAISVTDIQKGWGKTTYKGHTGYVSTSYLTKLVKNVKMNNRSINALSENHDKEENKMARCELYGFDNSGAKLFKFVIRDSDYWYEYIEPEAWIGNDLILEDGKKVPKPKTTTEKDGDKTVTKNIESGKFGDWNNFYGDFIIRRETTGLKQYWSVEVNKIQGGKVVKSLKSSKITNSKYPVGSLNHVVLWFGQHLDRPVPEEIGLTHLKVSRLNEVPVEADVINFAPGDELEIDCMEDNILLNGFEYMEKVDIGSEFFGCDAGISQFVVRSDDKDIYTSATIQERYI